VKVRTTDRVELSVMPASECARDAGVANSRRARESTPARRRAPRWGCGANRQGKAEKKEQKGHGPKTQPQLATVREEHTLDEADQQCGERASVEPPPGRVSHAMAFDEVQQRLVLVNASVSRFEVPLLCHTFARMSHTTNKSTLVSVRLPAATMARVVRLAKRQKASVSEVIRGAIDAIDSPSIWDRVRPLVSKRGSGLGDLSTNKKRLTGFGE
jgi:hypothetical protein